MGVRLVFPPFSFDREERILRRDGRVVPLAPKVAEALALLVAQPGALVEKNVLRDTLWPGGFVEDGNLTQTIYLIRRALDPQGDGRAYVETVPRRGYRFVHAVEQTIEERRLRGNRVAGFVFAARAVGLAAVIAVAFGGVSFGDVSSRSVPRLEGEAGRAYALGWYTWNRRTESGSRSSIAHFSRVIALRPNDARGYAGLAATYEEIADWDFRAIAPRAAAFRRAEAYAHEALRHDPRSGEASASLGGIALQRDGDLDRAESELRTAIAYNPDYSPAYEELGIVQLYRGDPAGARRWLARATELDPLSPMDLVWYGKSLYYERRFAEARATFRQLAELDANNHGASEMLVLADIELGLDAEARAAVAKMRISTPQKRTYIDMLDAYRDARAGHRVAGAANLTPRAAAHVDVATASALCLVLGRRADALRWIEVAFRDPLMRNERGIYRIDPRLSALRSDERFQALVARSG